MRKSTAIGLLREQQESLKSTYGNTFAAWKNHTISLIKDFFGENSPEYEAAKLLAYARVIDRELDYNTQTIINKTEKNTELILAFLENCIKKIQASGLYKKPKTNSFSRLSDTALWTLITIISSAIFYAGFWFGSHDLDKKEQSPTTFSPLPNANPKADSPAKK